MLEQRIPWQIVQDYPFVLSIGDEREEVVSHWRDAKSWVVPPVVVSGDLLGGGTGFELLVGFTRLGNLLGQCADLELAATGILQRRFSAGLDDLLRAFGIPWNCSRRVAVKTSTLAFLAVHSGRCVLV
jgi:hypothetical protein